MVGGDWLVKVGGGENGGTGTDGRWRVHHSGERTVAYLKTRDKRVSAEPTQDEKQV